MNKRIIYTSTDNILHFIVPAPNTGLSIEEIAQTAVPAGIQYKIIDADSMPPDIIFKAAWEEGGDSIIVNIDKARTVAHSFRRKSRDAEFEPYDKIISLQIPGNSSTVAESKRAEVRAKYEIIQNNIDAATTISKLKEIVEQLDK